MQTYYRQSVSSSPACAIVPTQARPHNLVRHESACTILVVDANDISRQVITSALETAGYETIALANAVSAEQTALASPPDLILQSLALPDVNCWDLAARLWRSSMAPIVGYASLLPPETRGGFKHAFAGFITKPFSPAHLVRSLPVYLWNKPVPPPLAARTIDSSSWETLTSQATLCDEPTEGQNVLIVDDNQFQRERLAEAFKNAGFSVSLARHGIEGLEKLGNQRPDLIVSDTLMTGCDGFELCLAVRKLTAIHGLRFLLTPPNQTDPLDELVAHALGADAYLSRAGGFERLIAAARLLMRTPAKMLHGPLAAGVESAR